MENKAITCFNTFLIIAMDSTTIPTLDVPTLQNWLDIGRPVTVFDVRPMTERQEWSIPGSQHADVYTRLKADDHQALENLGLPKNIPVVTVCEAGKMSLKAAEQLQVQGYTVYSLEGGMKAWSTSWNTAIVPTDDPKVTILQIRRTGKGCLSYIVACEGEALVIDASLDERVYIGLSFIHGWKIRYVLDTHLHADHLSRSPQLAQQTGAQLLMPLSDRYQFKYEPVTDQTLLTLGTTTLQAISTPGHTDESVCYMLDKHHLFTGDTLFIDSIGRPDLKTDAVGLMRKASQLYYSLHLLLDLPAITKVLPGHTSNPVAFDGQPILTDIDQLRHTLSWLAMPEAEFIDRILDRIPPTPPNYLTISELNQRGDFISVDPVDVEAGANRCAIR